MNALEHAQQEARLEDRAKSMNSIREPGTWLPSAEDRQKLRTSQGLTVKEGAMLVGVSVDEFERLESVDHPTRCPESYVQFVLSLR